MPMENDPERTRREWALTVCADCTRAALVLLALACVTAGAVLGALTVWGCSP